MTTPPSKFRKPTWESIVTAISATGIIVILAVPGLRERVTILVLFFCMLITFATVMKMTNRGYLFMGRFKVGPGYAEKELPNSSRKNEQEAEMGNTPPELFTNHTTHEPPQKQPS
jgi:hypothetical protein